MEVRILQEPVSTAYLWTSKKPVKNLELWQRLDEAQTRHDVTWEWVKGHAGHPENERADELARAGMAPFKPKAKSS